MLGERIVSIFNYCDRWCERCAYTSRCTEFQAKAAIAMCGDVSDGFELALGPPCPAVLLSEPARLPEGTSEGDHEEVLMPASEEAALVRREAERRIPVR